MSKNSIAKAAELLNDLCQGMDGGAVGHAAVGEEASVNLLLYDELPDGSFLPPGTVFSSGGKEYVIVDSLDGSDRTAWVLPLEGTGIFYVGAKPDSATDDYYLPKKYRFAPELSMPDVYIVGFSENIVANLKKRNKLKDF